MLRRIFSSKLNFITNRYDAIQALRGVAAIFVFFEHVRFVGHGAFGVDVFFCISGFMIMLSTEKSTSHFLLKRLIKILPLYWLMTFITWIGLLIFPSLFQSTQPQLEYLIKSLLFIPFEIGNAIRPIMGIGWSLNCEMFFYILFYLSFHINKKYCCLICSSFLAFIVFIQLLAGNAGVHSVILLFYGNSRMLEFVLGIGCYYYAKWMYDHFPNKAKKQFFIVAFVVSAIILVCLFLMHDINQSDFSRLIYWGVPSAVLVLLFFAIGLYYQFPTFIVHLGNISFSFYLMHYYIVIVLDRLCFDFGVVNFKSVIGVLLAFILTLFASEISNQLVEKKFTRFLQRKLLK